MIDLTKYDADLRAGASVLDISYRARCSPGTIYKHMRRHGIHVGERGRPIVPKRLRSKGFTVQGCFDYWPWLRGEVKRLGIANAILVHAYGMSPLPTVSVRIGGKVWQIMKNHGRDPINERRKQNELRHGRNSTI